MKDVWDEVDPRDLFGERRLNDGQRLADALHDLLACVGVLHAPHLQEMHKLVRQASTIEILVYT